jgi:hypothetical protein
MRRPYPAVLVPLVVLLLNSPAFGQIVFVDKGEQRLSLSGYFQTQYERFDERDSNPTDRVFVRRLMLTLQGTATRDWNGAFQIDLGPVAAGNPPVLKDLYLQYSGWTDRGVTLTIGNQKMPFSRSVIASSSRRHVVERPFAGDRAFGSPGRALAIKADGWQARKTLYWSAAIASALHAFDTDEIRVDGVAEAEQDWNEGWTGLGRVEWHPLGETTRTQGAFADDFRVTVAAAGYAWRNDGDTNVHTVPGGGLTAGAADADGVNGLEISGAVRGRRVSIDAEYERIVADALTPSFTGGLYRTGHARLHKASLEAGYMVIPRRFEVVGVLDLLAPAAYDEPSRRAAGELNWYLNEHRVRVQFMHRFTTNVRGVIGARSHLTALQAQFSF